MAQTVMLRLPEEIYRRLKQAAEVMQQPMEAVIMQTIKAGLPPAVDDLPAEHRKEFAVMARLSNEKLWAIARSTLPEARQRKLTRLLRKNQADTLTEQERRELEALHREANLITLRKAHAYALLKWRHYRIPTLAGLQKAQ